MTSFTQKTFCAFILFILASSGNVFADNKTSAPAGNSQTQNASVSFSDSDPDHWDPYPELEKMQHDFNRLFQSALQRAGRGIDWAQTQGGIFNPRMDLIEEKDRYVLKADIPGMDKNKLDLKVTDKSLTISGERAAEMEKSDKDKGVYQQERSFGRFQRTIPIPENVQQDKISAKYDLGVLTVELPKTNPTEPAPDNGKKIPIQ